MIHPTKRCCKCREIKPVSEFHKNKKRVDGLNPMCKACVSAYYRANADRIMQRQKVAQAARVGHVEIPDKRCPRCGETKPISDFYHDKRKAHGHTDRCKACLNEYANGYYLSHASDLLKKQRVYVHKHKDRIKKRHTEWLNRGDNRSRHNTNTSAFMARMRKLGYRSIRRDKRYGDRGRHTTREWQTLRAFFGNRCLCCGATDRISVDHVIPLSRGGRNDIQNLQPLCLGCNRRKNTTIVDYRDPDLLSTFLAMMNLPPIIARSHDRFGSFPIVSC